LSIVEWGFAIAHPGNRKSTIANRQWVGEKSLMSTVIKFGEAGKVLKRLTTVDLADHLAEARAVIDEAQRRAAQMIVQAKHEADRVSALSRQTGSEAGYREGYAAGTAAGCQAAHDEALELFTREQSHIVGSLQGAIAEIEAVKEDLRIRANRDLLDFAMLIARKLTFAIGSLHREAAAANLERALSLVGLKTDLSIWVHPADLASMETFAPALAEKINASVAVRVAADESIAPGGCVVRTDHVEVDARLDTQVDEIVTLLLGEGKQNG
jgi:flagellar assembly protein FliH